MKKTISLMIVLVLCMGVEAAKVNFIWTQKADMPTPRRLHACVSVNGKIYAIGGFPNEGTGSMLSSMEEYDTVSDTWTKKADMPTRRGSLSASVVGGKIYAIGGSGDGGSRVEEYDPVTDTWTRKADMPTERHHLTSCVLNGKIYAIGGTPLWNVWSGLRTVEEYDPVTDSWTRKADMNTGVWGLCTNVVNGKIYAFGGRPEITAIATVQEYDPATDSWTRKSDMPLATSQMASVVLDNKIFVIGGWLRSDNILYTAVQMYDPQTDTWTIEDDTPFLRATVSASVSNNKIYVIGGTDRNHPCPATSTVYELTINEPPPDFNGDGIVDSADMCIMVDHWGEDYTLCDISPVPFGDGIVDVEDLKILAEHLFEDVNDPTLIAHWPLDEAQGVIAYDSVSVCDGTLIGNPVWQPDSGIVAGALQFDGVDDYVSTDPVLNPTDSVFSIIAWVNGGAPGQVVVSQQGAANWLMTDTEGNLMTELKGTERSAGPLQSQTNITDGDWHRVGFVWDGTNRILYVDDVAVAEDTQYDLGGSASGLYIGAGKAMEAGTYFSGLIDDVRIYNRAVRP